MSIVAAGLLLPLPPSASPSALPEVAVDPRPGAMLPLDAQLRDERGALIRLGQVFGGRPVVLVFEYLSCPNLCGVVLGDLAAAIAEQPLRPGRDIEVVAISIDARDTPADAQTARARLGVDVGWHFLTGAGPEARRVAEAAGFDYRWDPELGQFAHPAAAIVVTPHGRVSDYLFGAGYEPAALQRALGGAASDSVATVATGLRVLCFGYDPSTGRYTSVVEQLLRAVGAGALLAVAGLVAWARRPYR